MQGERGRGLPRNVTSAHLRQQVLALQVGIGHPYRITTVTSQPVREAAKSKIKAVDLLWKHRYSYTRSCLEDITSTWLSVRGLIAHLLSALLSRYHWDTLHQTHLPYEHFLVFSVTQCFSPSTSLSTKELNTPHYTYLDYN